MSVHHVPKDHQALIPYLIIEDAEAMLRFLKEAFAGVEGSVMRDESGTIRHAQLRIEGLQLMLGQASSQWPASSCSTVLYVADVDKVFRQAVAAGAKVLYEPRNEFYGDRMAGIEDPAGNRWWIGTHVEDVSDEEVQRRMKSARPGQQ